MRIPTERTEASYTILKLEIQYTELNTNVDQQTKQIYQEIKIKNVQTSIYEDLLSLLKILSWNSKL